MINWIKMTFSHYPQINQQTFPTSSLNTLQKPLRKKFSFSIFITLSAQTCDIWKINVINKMWSNNFISHCKNVKNCYKIINYIFLCLIHTLDDVCDSQEGVKLKLVERNWFMFVEVHSEERQPNLLWQQTAIWGQCVCG
jgi:hypothetical protein